ncbi:50S ribosomal subunit-associated GTPase HflX [Streptomyces albogriseolus]|uniref:50S ribosomal subunit-associated GTPase HflX n=1 Tax=Streptomyces albogriseolus TaxID=1887 RepID=A0ACC6UVX5_STRAO
MPNSAKQEDFDTLMASAATALAAHGARVVARIMQRQGVSDGGARKLSPPYSSRTPLTYGKVREVASARDRADADAVIFTVSLTERQRRTLTDMLGRPAVSH